jgi:hypothetical protein
MSRFLPCRRNFRPIGGDVIANSAGTPRWMRAAIVLSGTAAFGSLPQAETVLRTPKARMRTPLPSGSGPVKVPSSCRALGGSAIALSADQLS